MVGFSEESLKRIETELKAVPAGNSYFSMNLSHDELSARYGLGEGIDVQ